MNSRLHRINALLRREISQVVQKEFDFAPSLVSVCEVSIDQELAEAKVFVSVLGGSSKFVFSSLSRKRGLIQSRIAQRITLRRTPILRFLPDHSAQRGVAMVQLLDAVDALPKAPEETEEKDA